MMAQKDGYRKTMSRESEWTDIYKSSPNHSYHCTAFSKYADKEDHQPLSYCSIIAGYPLPHTLMIL